MTARVNHWPTLSAALANPTLRVISHGGGTQTIALCLMAARGDVGPMPDVAIFADTGDEPQEVYERLEWIKPLLPFPLIVVRRTGPTLGEYQRANVELPRSGRSFIPLYMKDPIGMLPKQCNSDWKKRVVRREVKRLMREKLGLDLSRRLPADAVAEQWIGISTDEIERVRTSDERVIYNRYPLIENSLSRDDCLRWMELRQYPKPPRSSCVFCPFRRNDEWRHLRDTAPADWQRACDFDDAIRVPFVGAEGTAYVHRSRTPLRVADLADEDERQGRLGFVNECEGVCGT